MTLCGRFVVLVFAATTPCTSQLRAQDVYGGESLGFLETGTRVRVTTADVREIGELAYVGLDGFDVYIDGDQVPFSYSGVDLIEVSRGRKRGSQALTLGLGLLGLGIGLVVAANEDCSDDYLAGGCFLPWVIIPSTFAAGGLLLGWGLGQAIVTERWLPVAPVETSFEGKPRAASQPHLTLSFNLNL